MALKSIGFSMRGLGLFLQTLSVKTAVETLTNKTLTAPVITGGTATSKRVVTDIAGDGAITIAPGIVTLSKGSAAAITLAAPAAGDDGTVITIIAKSAYAHVVTFTGTKLNNGTNAKQLKATTAAYIGSGVSVVAMNQEWHLIGNTAATIAAS